LTNFNLKKSIFSKISLQESKKPNFLLKFHRKIVNFLFSI